jgi:preprotein translocase subunit SecY
MLLLLVGGFFGVVLAFFLAIVYVRAQGKAKKIAKKIISEGKITNEKVYNNTLKLLATTKDDLEAADLYHKLSSLKS